ncbi:hypothetical protein MMC17_005045 [Xylographa soralifera]|nr:hypothetical protein [Xylographa soralifera]
MPVFLSENIEEEDYDSLFEINYKAFHAEPILLALFPGGLEPSTCAVNVACFRTFVGGMEPHVAKAKVIDEDGRICAFATMQVHDENPFFGAEVKESAVHLPHIQENQKRLFLEWFIETKNIRRKQIIGLQVAGSYGREFRTLLWGHEAQPAAELRTLFTDPARQGEGAATLLLKWAVGIMDSKGLRGMLEASRVAVEYGLYEKHGFRPIDVHTYVNETLLKEEGITFVTMAIARCDDPPLSILDNRAATYTKLEELPKALADGRRMIQVAKGEVKGYLRTGQILQLMGKDKTALGIYEYGLKNVLRTNDDVKLLQGMHDKLVRKCSATDSAAAPKIIDPLKSLPMELAQMVLQNLSFRTIVSLLRVSKLWKAILESIPALWRHLDLSKTKKNVRFGSIKACVIRSGGTLTHATLSHYDSLNSDALTYIASRCKRLEYLELRTGISNESLLKAVTMTSTLKTLILLSGHEVSLDTVTQLLAQSKSLEHTEFYIRTRGHAAKWEGDLSKLRVLKLHAAKDSQGSLRLELDDLFTKAPHLHTLSLQTRTATSPRIASDYSSLTSLRTLSLTDVDIATFPCLPRSLQSLSLINAWGIGSRSDVADAYMDRNDFSSLTSLTVSAARYLRPVVVAGLIGSGRKKLQKLDLRDFDASLGIAALINEGHLAEVTDLRLSNADVSDDLVGLVARCCPKLRDFDASYNMKLTGVGVKALVLKEGGIQRLNLDHCVGVGSDAVEYARAKGVVVHFTFPDIVKSGKRVRLG